MLSNNEAPTNKKLVQANVHRSIPTAKELPDKLVPKGPDLAELIDRVNNEHRLAIEHCKKGLESARRIGALLLEAKAAVGHGGFGDWVQQHCSFSNRSAQRYIQVAKKWESIEAMLQSEGDASVLPLSALPSLLRKSSGLDNRPGNTAPSDPSPSSPPVTTDVVTLEEFRAWLKTCRSFIGSTKHLRSSLDSQNNHGCTFDANFLADNSRVFEETKSVANTLKEALDDLTKCIAALEPAGNKNYPANQEPSAPAKQLSPPRVTTEQAARRSPRQNRRPIE